MLTLGLVFLQERKDEIAAVETVNNGKSLLEARLDVDTAWQCLEYYAGLAGSMAGECARPGFLHLPFCKQELVNIQPPVPWLDCSPTASSTPLVKLFLDLVQLLWELGWEASQAQVGCEEGARA